MTKKRFEELDSLRGIAAVAVLVFHFATMSRTRNQFLVAGVTGVDLFFLISGFVIFMTLNKIKSGYEFIISRMLRLFPTYLVMMAITLLVIFIFNRATTPSPKIILGNLTMMQPFFFVPYIDDSYWTLTVEIQFYILMFILFVFGWLSKIEWVGSFILGGIMLYYFISFHYFENSRIYIIPRSVLPLISHFELFFAGIIFYNIRQKGANLIRYALLFVCLLCALFLFDKSGRAHFFMGVAKYTVILSFYFVLFYLCMTGKLRFLNIRILLFLGNISYGLYLIHQEAGKVLYNYLVDNKFVHPFTVIILLFIFIILIAALVTHFIEKPVRNLKTYLIKTPVSVTPEYANDGII